MADNIRDEHLIAEFGARVRAARYAAGLTIEDLAAKAGIDYQQVSRVELGRVNTTISTAIAIARALGMQPGELLDNIT